MLKGKWKALLVLNYLNAGFFLLLILTNVVTKLQESRAIGAEGMTIVIMGAVLFCFNILNIYVLKVFYPARQLKGKVKFFYVAGICTWYIVFLLFFLSGVFGVSQIFLNGEFAKQNYNYAALVFLFMISIVVFLIAFWQTQLISFLKRNEKTEMESIVDSIGTDLTNNS